MKKHLVPPLVCGVSVLFFLLIQPTDDGRGEEEIAEGLAIGLEDVILVASPADVTLVEVGDVVTDAEHGVHVVGVDNGGDVVLLGDVVNELVDADGGLRVQTRVGFVAEEVFGLEGNGAGYGNALLHTARQFAGHLEKGILEPHAIEAELHTFLNLGAVHVTEHT